MKERLDKIVKTYFDGGDWKHELKKYNRSNYDYYLSLIRGTRNETKDNANSAKQKQGAMRNMSIQ